MSRYSPKNEGSRRATRKGSNAGTFAAGTVAVVVVFAFLAYCMRTPDGTVADNHATAASQPVAASNPIEKQTAPDMSTATNPVEQPHSRPMTAATPVAATVASAAPRSNTASRPADSKTARAKLLRDQLNAGEFAAAMVTAKSATNAVERSQLLKTIADAQAAIGDFAAADRSISRISVPESRDRGHAEVAARQSAAGGAANPSQLVNLIKQTTGTPDDWEEGEEGVRKAPQYWPPGIEVDPNGLLRGLAHQEKGQTLSALGHRAREADLNTDMRAVSRLRLVSLARLEKAIAKRLAEGRNVPETMQHLAGLSQVRYVFVYPDQHDVVVGGPAEGWRYNENGAAVGRESGRPSLYLDDLVTVIRTFAPRGAGYFNCQILPREEGLRNIKQFVEESNAGGPLDAASVARWTNMLQQKLGLQDVEINGIADDSRVAQVIFEADYRLKLIGIGKLAGGPGIPSYFDLLPRTGAVKSQKMDALRWWLSMKYDAVLHSADHNTFEIQGSAVLCQSENEKISTQGQRVHTGRAEATNRLFAANFTRHYAELAAKDPIFADLQNIFDLALVAALLTDNRVSDRVGWDLGVFGPSGQYRTAHYQPPKAIQSVVNHRVYNGKDIVVQVAGGVDGQMHRVLEDSSVYREGPQLAKVAASGRAPQLPEGRWWWDAKSP